MRIYTRTGDRGETSLRWGERIPKDNLRVEAYGTVDETNAAVGLALSLLPVAASPLADKLRQIQRELFDVGADLAARPDRATSGQPKVQVALVTQLEQAIDELTATLPPLKHFILPGGTPAASALHVARTVCRRAERRVVSLMAVEPVDPILLQYLNRLSDYLFVAARAVNQVEGVADSVVVWPK
ncbi:MAG: cob(I)yrinic acid a,c-diamide adenosyltransferase [Mycobacterium leprae]